MKWTELALAILTVVMAASGQSVPSGPTFEVAVIKEVGPSSDPLPIVGMFAFGGGPGTKSPERIEYSPVTLRMLLARAYNLHGEQIFGPDWLDTKWFSVIAKLPPRTTPEQLRQMLRALLSERFEVRSHSEVKRTPIYRLTLSKGSLKLKPAQSEIKPGTDVDLEALRKSAMEAARNAGPPGFRRMRRPRTTMTELANDLSSNLDRQVVDRTGLTGRYDIELAWDSSLGQAATGGADRGPSLFVAVEEQLGLRLQASVEDVEVLVVDGARSSPTSN